MKHVTTLLISLVFLANAAPLIVQGRGYAYSYITLALAGVGLIAWGYVNWHRRGKGDPDQITESDSL
jgi:hypothetical protein